MIALFIGFLNLSFSSTRLCTLMSRAPISFLLYAQHLADYLVEKRCSVDLKWIIFLKNKQMNISSVEDQSLDGDWHYWYKFFILTRVQSHKERWCWKEHIFLTASLPCKSNKQFLRRSFWANTLVVQNGEELPTRAF